MPILHATARYILRLDLVTEQISRIGPDCWESIWKYSGMVLGDDSYIYGVPANARHVFTYNPMDQTSTFIGCTTTSIICCDNYDGQRV
mmetsp:Transcript_17538/g.20925  ORF Transcript_17538/g.20925 Transcript_17538/m.20925 type:complete len:88 (+) Transcript_17538:354-617(+)